MFNLNLVAQHFRFIALISVVTAVVTACSGGGGGGSNADPNKVVQLELPPVEFKVIYSGSTVVAPLNLFDAHSFFSLAWGDPINLPPLVERATQTPRMISAVTNAAATTIVRPTRRAAKISSQNKQAFAAAVSANQSIKGVVSGTMTISGARNADGTGVVTLTYQNFSDGDGVVYDGQIIELIRAYDRDFDLATDASMEIELLKIKSSNNAVSISGKFDEKFDLTTLVDTYTFNVDGIVENTKEGFRYQNFIATVFYSETGNAVSESFSGRVFLASQGFVDVTTAAPLACSVCPSLNPDNGGPVILVGKNQSRAKISPRSETRVRVDVDEDGDLTYEKSALYLWANLTGDAVPNHAPSVAAITINPTSAFIDSELSMVTQPATDEDGDPLTISYQWLKNGVVLSSATQSKLAAKSFVKKDVIEARLIVSDGIDTTQQTASVTIKNSIPVAGTPTFNSSKVYVTDTLTVIDPLVTDADSDPLTFSYAWAVNNVTLSNAKNSNLNLASFKKGDVISATVSIFDGDVILAVVTAPLTISDSPPQITSSAPSQINYSSPLAFNVKATDADKDPVTISLRYGPTNMSLNSSGTVSWKPDVPMFGTTLDVHYGIRAVAAGLITDYDGTIALNDAKRLQPLVRSGIQLPGTTLYGDPNYLRVADFDGKGRSDIVATNGTILWTMKYDGVGYTQDWIYPFYLGSIESIETYDINGDGHPDIMVGTNSNIAIIDGVTRSLIATIEDGNNHHYSVHVVDVNNDGVSEIVYIGEGISVATVEVVSAQGLKHIWSSSPISPPGHGQIRSLAIGNVDNDAALEIVTSDGFVFDGATLATQWAYMSPLGTQTEFGENVTTGDIDGDGIDEIIAYTWSNGNKVFSAITKSVVTNFGGSGIGGINSLAAKDINTDGRAELIVGRSFTGTVDILSYNVLTKAFDTNASIPVLVADSGSAQAVVVGDTNGDGKLDIVALSVTGGGIPGNISVISATSAPIIEWTSDKRGGIVNPPATAFFEPSTLYGPFFPGGWSRGASAAMIPEFLAPAPDAGASVGYSTLIQLNPQTGLYRVQPAGGAHWHALSNSVGADYDGDKSVETVFVSEENGFEVLIAYDTETYAVKVKSTALGSTTNGATRIDLVAADLNGDGHPDFVFHSSDGSVYAYDLFTNKLIWKSSQPIAVEGIAVGDLNGDGVPEIVITANMSVHVYKKTAGSYALDKTASASTQFGGLGLDLVVIGNFDSSPSIDLVVVSNSGYNNGHVYVLDGQSLAEKTNYGFAQTITDVFAMAGPNGHQNVALTLTGVPSSSAATEIRAIDPMTGKAVWSSPALLGAAERHGSIFLDTNGDGILELITGTSSAMYVTR